MPFFDPTTLGAAVPNSIIGPPLNPNGLSGLPIQDTSLFSSGQSVSPDASWIHYACILDLDEDDHIAESVPLAGTVTTSAGGGADALGDLKTLRNNARGGSPTVASSVLNIIQRVSGPTFAVRLVGEAVRIQYPIAPPVLLTVGGQTAVQKGRNLVTRTVGALGGLPLIYLSWNIRYVIGGAPSTLGQPADIDTDMNGVGA